MRSTNINDTTVKLSILYKMAKVSPYHLYIEQIFWCENPNYNEGNLLNCIPNMAFKYKYV